MTEASPNSGKHNNDHGPILILYALFKILWVSFSLFPFSVSVLDKASHFNGFALVIAFGLSVIWFYCIASALILIFCQTVFPAVPKKKNRLILFVAGGAILFPLFFLLLRGNAPLFLERVTYDGSGLINWMHQGFSDINLPKRQLASFILFYFIPIAVTDFALLKKNTVLTRLFRTAAGRLSHPLAAGFLLTLLSAILLRMQTECSCSHHPFDDILYGQFPLYGLVNILIIWAVIVLLSLLPGNYPGALLVTGILTTVLSLVNYYTLLWHGTYFRLEELRNIRSAMNVLDAYQITVSEEPVHILLCFIAICVIAKIAGQRLSPPDLRMRILSGSFVILSAGLVVSGFILHNNTGQNLWNLQAFYNQNGMLLSTLQTTYVNALPKVTQPDGYDASALFDDTYLQYAREAGVSNDQYPDIILILNEAWYDMDFLEETHANRDYMETWHSLRDNAVTGHALVPGTGGLTNASEYELLTSNSMHLLRTDTPNNALDFGNPVSVVSYLESLGYASLAVHPGEPSSYRRGIVWDQLGFDERYFTEDLHNQEYYGNRTSFATDSSLFREFTALYEKMPSGSPRLCFLLTIQNHGDWNHNPPSLNYVKSGERFSYAPAVSEQIDEFLTCTSQTDDMIRELVSYFTETDRPVVVCMAGDHAPSFIHDISSTKHSPAEQALARRATPFMIWSNRTLHPVSVTSSTDSVTDLCCLTPLTLQAAGLPLSPYYGVLTQLADNHPPFTRVTHAEESELLSTYFHMEYHLLGEKNGSRNDNLFLP